MRVFLSTIGSRGEVQPLLGLAQALVALGHRATICAPPNFGPWLADLGVEFTPLGPDVQNPPPGPPPASPAEAAARTVRTQFETLRAAAPGHDLLLGAGALQLAARSVAEALGLRFAFAAYCPLVLPSALQPPVKFFEHHPLSLSEAENRALWDEELPRWDQLWGPPLNAGRAALGLPPVEGVLAHMLGDEPWLATDPLLGPAPRDRAVRQTGAWRPEDPGALPAALERFLDAGDPPVTLGLGSNRAPAETGPALLAAARAVGRRAILSRGWAGLSAEDRGADWLAIDSVPHDALLPRVAAVLHHGGAGTTTSAALAGRPQIVLPHHYDQHYWGDRVEALGIGVKAAVSRPVPPEALPGLLEAALEPAVAARAEALAQQIVRDGAQRAAAQLTAG